MRTRDNIIEKYTIHFEIHDFGFLLPGLDDILRLKRIYPNFKITCFTIPLPREFYLKENAKHFKIEKYKRWAEIINSYEWMEIGMHGFSHTPMEMGVDYYKTIDMIKATENLWNEVGLKFKKICVAPFWQYSYEALNALKDKGYAVGLNRNNPIPVPKGLETFLFTWSVEEPILSAGYDVIAHAHTTSRGVRNGLAQSYNNIISVLPKEVKFDFLSNLIKKQYEENNKEKGNKEGGD